jgi:hypothetical protein
MLGSCDNYHRTKVVASVESFHAQEGLEQVCEGDSTMTHQFLKLAAAGAIVALTATSTPAQADDMVQNIGPVGPNEPILATFGEKRIVASFTSGSGACALQAVVWNADDIDAKSAAQFRVSLDPGQTTQIDGSSTDTLKLQCGAYARTLAVVDNGMTIASK